MNDVWNGDGIYQSIVETILDCAICLLDVEGRVGSWNAGAERIIGYQRRRSPAGISRFFTPPKTRGAVSRSGS